MRVNERRSAPDASIERASRQSTPPTLRGPVVVVSSVPRPLDTATTSYPRACSFAQITCPTPPRAPTTTTRAPRPIVVVVVVVVPCPFAFAFAPPRRRPRASRRRRRSTFPRDRTATTAASLARAVDIARRVVAWRRDRRRDAPEPSIHLSRVHEQCEQY